MKNIFYLVICVSILFYSCGSTNKTVAQQGVKEEPVRIANDSLEYEIMILDIGFNSFLTSARPESFYTQSNLELKNRIYVLDWNSRARNPSKYDPSIYENIIDYQVNIDYGMEVNYKLYMYFQFAQTKYRTRLSSFRVDAGGNSFR